ncbi:MAG: 2-keto-4-pentenoate hydratase [Burkholderiaceae bacterium]
MDHFKQGELTKLLARLRMEHRQQSGLAEGLAPPDLDTAYQSAGLVAKELGWTVGGWKIAAIKQEMQLALRTDRPIYGRVYQQFISETPLTIDHTLLTGPLPEVEYQARLGKDLPPRDTPYSVREVTEAVASLHPGIEIGECRFVHDERFPPLTAILADGAGSGHLITGPQIDNWRERDIANQIATLSRNGDLKRQGSASAAIDHPMMPLTWLANELSRTGVGLKEGEIVSTGTLTGMIAARPGETYDADYGTFGSVRVSFA